MQNNKVCETDYDDEKGSGLDWCAEHLLLRLQIFSRISRKCVREEDKIIIIKDAHRIYDTEFIKAENIIKHHNSIIGKWFAELVPTSEVRLL